MWTTFTQKVRKAFTDAADQYDILTSLHKEIGRELVKKVVKEDAAVILDVGCGTGYVANKAKFFFPESRIIGIDIAEGMLAKAMEAHEGIAINWLQADAEHLPFKDQSINLICSNLAYQWVQNLENSFKDARRVLHSGGILNATLFGSRTAQELFESLRFANPRFQIRPIPSYAHVEKALVGTGFQNIKTDFELIKVEFKDIHELLGWMKAIGANHLGVEGVFLGKQMLAKANEYYTKHYPYNDGIAATFEVIWVYAHNN